MTSVLWSSQSDHSSATTPFTVPASIFSALLPRPSTPQPSRALRHCRPGDQSQRCTTYTASLETPARPRAHGRAVICLRGRNIRRARPQQGEGGSFLVFELLPLPLACIRDNNLRNIPSHQRASDSGSCLQACLHSIYTACVFFSRAIQAGGTSKRSSFLLLLPTSRRCAYASHPTSWAQWQESYRPYSTCHG